MPQKLALFLFLFLCLLQKTHAGAIIGLDEAINDTSSSSIENKVSQLLSTHPLLSSSGVADKEVLRPHADINKTGVFFLAIFLLFGFSLARLVFPRYFSNLLQIFSTITFSKRHIKEQLENDNRASLWFYAIFFFSIGFIVYQFFLLNSTFHLSDKWLVNYSICTTCVFLLYSLRVGMIRLVGWIFNRSDYVSQYLFNNKLINDFLGLVLFPLGILILIAETKIKWILLMIAGSLILVTFVYSYLRNIPLLRNLLRISFVHFLLYICAFEVIPVLILIKMIR